MQSVRTTTTTIYHSASGTTVNGAQKNTHTTESNRQRIQIHVFRIFRSPFLHSPDIVAWFLLLFLLLFVFCLISTSFALVHSLWHRLTLLAKRAISTNAEHNTRKL